MESIVWMLHNDLIYLKIVVVIFIYMVLYLITLTTICSTLL